MKQKICAHMIKMLSCIAIICVILGMCPLVDAKNNTEADLVVYGKIFTSENNKIVESFAVKDGKYVYVGDKAGVKAFIKKGTTEIIDYSGKGLVMPSCGNGHAHYSIGHGIPKAGTMIDFDDSVEKFLTEIVPAAVKKQKTTIQRQFSVSAGII